MTLKLRFAPSPTGNLHIGSVRTAIFNWVWAKSLDAQLVLRIEDTDMQRSKKEFEDNIFEGLDWLGIQFDEGPNKPNGAMQYRQSERLKSNVYQSYIDTLIESGDAYYCFETDEELDEERKAAEEAGIAYMYSRKSLGLSASIVSQYLSEGRPYTIRFKVPDTEIITVDDKIRGQINFEAKLLSDFIIVKSDGAPTYNFAVVIDDYEMGITHVVRGEDHISNTPKQMMIFKALGFNCPVFAHLPIILGEDRSKLSKRHGAKSVSEYRNSGFLPHALINYLSLLGWSPPEGKELLSLDELFSLFDISRINKAGAVFDAVKMTWMNKQYLAKVSDQEFLQLVSPFIDHSLLISANQLDEKILSVRDNVDVLSNVNQYLEVYNQTDSDFLARLRACTLAENDLQVIQLAKQILAETSTWDESVVESLIGQLMATLSLGKGKVMKPLRKGVTGYESGPNLTTCLALIPLETIQNHIELTIKEYA